MFAHVIMIISVSKIVITRQVSCTISGKVLSWVTQVGHKLHLFWQTVIMWQTPINLEN